MEDIRTIFFDDATYPEALRQIPSPPKTLYVRGRMPTDGEKCLAVVGTRRCSDYGKRAVLDIVGDLIGAGLTIVSGLARGIDSFAHQASLLRDGKTIAVLGSGVNDDCIYPKDNLRLAKEIIANGGAIISEYPPNAPVFPYYFPLRNRIIAGLSMGTLIIEAKEKSGALITARFTVQQKKKLFSLPGSIYSLNSQGTNRLIQEGAKLITKAEDILTEIGVSPQLHKAAATISQNACREERLVLETLQKEALHIDRIVLETKLNTSVVNSTLAILEAKNQIKSLGGNVYALL